MMKSKKTNGAKDHAPGKKANGINSPSVYGTRPYGGIKKGAVTSKKHG